PDNGRAVVQRGVGKEQADQQLHGDDRVDLDAGLDEVRQPGAAFQHDQRADLAQPQDARRPRDVVDEADDLLAAQRVRRESAHQHAAAAQLLEHAPQLRLKDDQQSNGNDYAQILQDELQGVQTHRAADRVSQDENHHAGDQLHRARAANYKQQ